MIRIRAWTKWQGPAVYEIVRKRKKDARRMPVILGYVAVASDFDDETGNFERFSALVGGGILARGYLVMVLGYVARKDASSDIVRCGPDQFGNLVLSDRTISTPPRVGRKVYEALILSGIAEEVDASTEAQSGPPDTRPDTREDGPPSGPPSGAGRVDEIGSDSPLAPLPGGTDAPSAQEPQDAPDDDRPLRPRERERFAKVVEYVASCGTKAESAAARDLRHRLSASEVPDDEIAELLAGKFAWVTRERLARHIGAQPQTAPRAPAPMLVTTSAPKRPVCAPHSRLLPCGVCDIAANAANAAKRRAEGATTTPAPAPAPAPTTAAEVIRRGLALTARGKPTTDKPAASTRPETPPGDAEMRAKMRAQQVAP